MGVFGDTLRQARAQKGVTLKEAEQATRINRHHLSALEDENFAVLPALIYQRGIVRNYAGYLDLEPGKLLASFEEARGGTAPNQVVAAAMRPLDMPSHWAPNFAIIAFMVVMSAIVFAWIYSMVFSEPVADSATMTPLPTVTPVPTILVDDPLPAIQRQIVPNRGSPAVGTGGGSGDVSPTPRQVVQAPAVATEIPTATVTTTPMATAPPAPTATSAPAPTEAPPTIAPTALIVVEQSTQSVEEPTQVAPAGDTVTIRVLASSDGGTAVTVVGADGQVVFSDWLAAGTATDWFTSGSFIVTSSDPSVTLFENQAHLDWGPFPIEVNPEGNYYLSPIG